MHESPFLRVTLRAAEISAHQSTAWAAITTDRRRRRRRRRLRQQQQQQDNHHRDRALVCNILMRPRSLSVAYRGKQRKNHYDGILNNTARSYRWKSCAIDTREVRSSRLLVDDCVLLLFLRRRGVRGRYCGPLLVVSCWFTHVICLLPN
jgi:hypothetical protein